MNRAIVSSLHPAYVITDVTTRLRLVARHDIRFA